MATDPWYSAMTEAVRQEENNNSDIPQRRHEKQKNNQKKSTNAYISPPARGPRHGEVRWQFQSASSIMWPAVSPNLQQLRPRSSITLEDVCIPSSPTQTLSQFFLPSIAITRHEFSGQLQNQLSPTVKTSWWSSPSPRRRIQEYSWWRTYPPQGATMDTCFKYFVLWIWPTHLTERTRV